MADGGGWVVAGQLLDDVEFVECPALAIADAEVAGQLERSLLAGGGGGVVAAQPLHCSEPN